MAGFDAGLFVSGVRARPPVPTSAACPAKPAWQRQDFAKNPLEHKFALN